MKIYSATILIQEEKEEGRIPHYRYKDMSPTPHSFVTLIFNHLRKKSIRSIWTPDDDLKKGLVVRICVYTPNGVINKRPRLETITFCQETLETPKDELDNNPQKPKKPKIPIIHVVLTDIFSYNLYKNQKLHQSIPRYFQITDSSIWNYYVPMVKFDTEDNSFAALFTNAVNRICVNYHNDLYESEVAKEYADVNARIVRQSRLSGNHALGVAPHIFHSETAIERLNETEFSELKEGFKEKKGKGAKARWRFLLVDDNAFGEDGTMKNNCKLSIIMRLIEKALFPGKSNWVQYRLLEQTDEGLSYPISTLDENARILIDCALKYDDANSALQENKYDIILLDYLLDLQDEQRKYGYELLEEINRSVKINNQFERFRYLIDYSSDEEKANELIKLISKVPEPHNTENDELRSFIRSLKINGNKISDCITKDHIESLLETIQIEIEKKPFQIGPCGKLFFVFISAYSTAVNERLLAQGLNRSEDHWYINTGACPTNTPQLFTFNLLHSMNKRLNDCGILKLTTVKILELVAKIFRPDDKKNDKKDSVRKRASFYYHKVLTMQYHYRKMLDDVEIPPHYANQPESIFYIKKSVLISHYSSESQHLSGLMEHLTNLVHIAAFGTIRQWDEMWEEYLYFKAQFKVIMLKEKREDDEKNKIANIFQGVCEHIESFILGLKSQQR